MKKTIGILLLLAAALGLGFYFKNSFLGKPESATGSAGNAGQPAAAPRVGGDISLDGFVVKSASLADALALSGTLRPAEEVEIRPEISGRMIQMNLAEGKSVARGDLLVKLFDGDIQASLEKLRQQKSIAEKTVERLSKLLAASGTSQQELDLAQGQVNNINADISLAQAQLTRTEIRAPFSGRLGLRNVSPGAFISPTMILTILYQTNPLKIDFSVPESHASHLHEGAILRFTVDGISGQFSGKVSVIEPKIDEATRTVKVRAIVQNSGGKLMPGAFAKIDLNLRNFSGLVVPSQAILLGSRDKKVVVSKNGKAEMVAVKTGQRDENRVEITSGLSAGDTIVTTGLQFVKAGQGLKFRQVN